MLTSLLVLCMPGCLQGVGIGWGASAEVLPPAPRFMDLQELLDEADACDATLLLMLDDSSVASGQLQVRNWHTAMQTSVVRGL